VQEFGDRGGARIVVASTVVAEGAFDRVVGVRRFHVLRTSVTEVLKARGVVARLGDQLPAKSEGVRVTTSVQRLEEGSWARSQRSALTVEGARER